MYRKKLIISVIVILFLIISTVISSAGIKNINDLKTETSEKKEWTFMFYLAEDYYADWPGPEITNIVKDVKSTPW